MNGTCIIIYLLTDTVSWFRKGGNILHDVYLFNCRRREAIIVFMVICQYKGRCLTGAVDAHLMMGVTVPVWHVTCIYISLHQCWQDMRQYYLYIPSKMNSGIIQSVGWEIFSMFFLYFLHSKLQFQNFSIYYQASTQPDSENKDWSYFWFWLCTRKVMQNI